MTQLKIQLPNQIVDVAPFLVDEAAVYPEGKRDKAYFRWRGDRYPFCLPDRLYMFKRSRDIYPQQYWVEIFAYHLGCLINVPVPLTFVALDSQDSMPGALIEWFYDDKSVTYTRGGDAMQSLMPDYDRKKGELHNLKSILDYCNDLNSDRDYWLKAFAKIITFDALLGNTDRHQENWGILFEAGEYKLSPAFDNGTSMGHEISNFSEFDNLSRIRGYVGKGKHHMKWDVNQDRVARENHKDFLIRYVQEYPVSLNSIKSCLDFNSEDVKNRLDDLCSFDIEHRLTPERAMFMLKLLNFRRDNLLQYFGDL